jgi:hypothetical protein
LIKREQTGQSLQSTLIKSKHHLTHTPIGYQLYHYVCNRSETEAFKFKIAPYKQKSIVHIFWQEGEASLTNEALCLSTPKHNGKFGTGETSR